MARKRRSIGEWLEEEMDERPRRSRTRRRDDDDGDKFETIASAISMLEEKLEGATHSNGNPRRRRNYAGDDHDLGEVIAQITSQQDALDHQYNGHNTDNIQRLQSQVRDLRGVIEAATHGSAYPGLAHDIQALQQQINPQLPLQAQGFSGMGDPMQRAFNSSLGQQLQALGQRNGHTPGAQTYLPAPVATGTSVVGIEALRRDVQTLRNSLRTSNDGRTLQGLEGEIRALNRKLNEGGVSNAARDIQDIKARMDHLNRSIQESGASAKNSYLTAQLQYISESIARVQRPVLPDRLVEDIRRELADATRKLVPLSIHDAKTLEKNIQFLAERLDSLRARQPDNARLQALEEQLGRLTAQLGQTDVFTGIERMEKSLQELTSRLGQDGSGSLDNKTVGVLRGFQKQIEEVKATADASDKRMNQTLHTLQDVIVKVASTGGAAASAKIDSSFGSRSGATVVTAAREAAARATQADSDIDAQEALDLGDEPATQRLENSFHAANAQMKKALRADSRGRAFGYEDGAYAPNVTPFRRIKRVAAQGLLAAAGIVLVIGIYNVIGPILSGQQTATASVVSTETAEQATGLAFTAPKAEASTEQPATQAASAEPTIAPQKLNINLPAIPAGVGPHLRASAQNGDVRAFFEIGSRLVDGSRGVTRDVKLGLDWLQLAADQRHAPALYRIASLYEKGQGIPRNIQQAVKNYQAATELGSRKSMHNLGALFASGIDGEPDFEKALPLFRQAANLGLIDSQYNLAIVYVTGMGVKQDLAEAYKWFAIAAANGDAESGKKRDEIGSRFDGKTLVKAKLAAQSFKPQALDPAANEDVIPPSSWADNKATPATADLSSIKPAGGTAGQGLSIDMSQAAQTQ
jgi:TPR repeat protein